MSALGAGQEQIVDWDESGRAPAVSEEQRQKIEAAQKENEKIKGLNETLKQAKDLEGAGNYDQAITILQQATTVDPTQDLVWAYLGDAQRGAKKYADAVGVLPEGSRHQADQRPLHGPVGRRVRQVRPDR